MDVGGKMRAIEYVSADGIDPAEHSCAEAPQDSAGPSDAAISSVLH